MFPKLFSTAVICSHSYKHLTKVAALSLSSVCSPAHIASRSVSIGQSLANMAEGPRVSSSNMSTMGTDYAIALKVKSALLRGEEDRKHKVSLLIEIGKMFGDEPVFDIHEDMSSLYSKNKTFICVATFNGFKTEGKGPSKKDAKTKAAANLLEKIEQLVDSAGDFAHLEIPSGSKKSSGDSTANKSESPMSSNTVGKLQELMVKLGYGLPQYAQLEETGQPHNKEFTMIVKVPRLEVMFEGKGRTKKEAKKMAAAKMLEKLETGNLQSSSGSSTPSSGSPSLSKDLREFFLSDDDEMFELTEADLDMNKSGLAKDPPDVTSVQTLEILADEKGIKLKYHFLDKSDEKNELCLVKAHTDPPIVCQGMGKSREIARADAAQNMLQYIHIMEKAGKKIISK